MPPRRSSADACCGRAEAAPASSVARRGATAASGVQDDARCLLCRSARGTSRPRRWPSRGREPQGTSCRSPAVHARARAASAARRGSRRGSSTARGTTRWGSSRRRSGTRRAAPRRSSARRSPRPSGSRTCSRARRTRSPPRAGRPGPSSSGARRARRVLARGEPRRARRPRAASHRRASPRRPGGRSPASRSSVAAPKFAKASSSSVAAAAGAASEPAPASATPPEAAETRKRRRFTAPTIPRISQQLTTGRSGLLITSGRCSPRFEARTGCRRRRSKMRSARPSNQPERAAAFGESKNGTYGLRSSTGVRSRRSRPSTTTESRLDGEQPAQRERDRVGPVGRAARERPRGASSRNGSTVGAQPIDSCRCAITQTCEKPSRSARQPRCGSVRTMRDGPVVSASGCSGMPSSECAPS